VSGWPDEPVSTTKLHDSGPISSPSTLKRLEHERGSHEVKRIKTSFDHGGNDLYFNALTKDCGGV
jgi:hypothetical protein